MSHKCKDKHSHKHNDKCRDTCVKTVDTSKLRAKRASINKVHTKTIKADKISAKKDLCNRRVITRKDFLDCETLTLSKTFVIEEEGNYVLGENIEFEAAFDFQNAIQILADNVCLDLCCNFIKQVNDVGGVTGIRIGEDFGLDTFFKNITIRNGGILNMTGQGIGALNVAIAVAGDVFKNILIEDMNVLECGVSESFFSSGIDFDSLASPPGDDVAYKNITIRRCKANNCLGHGAIEVFTGDSIVIEDCQGNNLFSGDPAADMFGLTAQGNNIQITGCQFNNTRIGSPENISDRQCGGLKGDLSENLVIRNCQFNGAGGFTTNQVSNRTFACSNLLIENTQFNFNENFASGSCFGLYCNSDPGLPDGPFYARNCEFNNTFSAGDNVQGCRNGLNNAVFENCQFNETTAGITAFGAAAGHINFRSSNLAQGVKFLNCQFNNTTNLSTNAIGAFGLAALTHNDTLLEDCEAINIKAANGEFAVGFFLPMFTGSQDNQSNFVLRRCIASDINLESDLPTDTQAVGFFVGSDPQGFPFGNHMNSTLEGCIAQKIFSRTANIVAGIRAGYSDFRDGRPGDKLKNLYIRDCRVSDVRSTAEIVSPRSAGILVESFQNPVICNNSVSDCDRGILLSRSDEIIPNAFQVALTQQDALDDPPIVIDLGQPMILTTDILGVGPYIAILAAYSPPFNAVIPAEAGLADPNDQSPAMLACAPLAVDLTGKIGICRRGSCAFVDKTTNVEGAGAITTIVVSTGAALVMGGSPTGAFPSFSISNTDGNELIDAVLNNPPVNITLTPLSLQTFDNVTQANSINVESVVDTTDFIFPEQKLNILGWQRGDQLTYNCNGGAPIPGLDCGETYYAVVFRPDFAERGLIQQNKVDNCSVSGYQDDKEPTASAWVDNVALLNGPTPAHDENYAINWQGAPQVDEGTLAQYPLDPNKYYNLSLI